MKGSVKFKTLNLLACESQFDRLAKLPFKHNALCKLVCALKP
jgi:hypothetical protein